MTEDQRFELKIISPDGIIYEEACDYFEFTSVKGRMGVYKNHIPTTAILSPCTLLICHDGKKDRVRVGEGFVEILGSRVMVLTEKEEK